MDLKGVGGISSNGRGSGEESPVLFIQEEGDALMWRGAEVLGCHQGGELKTSHPVVSATVPGGHYFLSPKLCSAVERFGRTLKEVFEL